MYPARAAYRDDAVANQYDAIRFGTLSGRLIDRLEQQLVARALRGLPAGARVLDVPAGTGRMTRHLRELGFDPVGADISEAMLRQARQHDGKLPLVLADAERLPFPEGAFRAVVAVRLMHHVPPRLRPGMLAEFRRVSSGLVVVTYADSRTVQGTIRRLKAARDRRRPPIYPATSAEVVGEARRAGLHLAGNWPMVPGYASTRLFALAPAR